MFVGRNLVVIVAGDFDPAAAKTAGRGDVRRAPAGDGLRSGPTTSRRRAAQPRVLLVDKPDATQTYFVIAQPGARRSSPDRTALTAGEYALRRALHVDDQRGAADQHRTDLRRAVRASRCARLTGGLFISSYTKTETTERAIDLALDVLKRLREKGITAEQLASAKAYMKGTYPPRTVQTADQIATVLGEMELFGLGRDEVDGFFARVDGVTLEQANQAIQKYYHTDNLTFVLLGNAAKIRDCRGEVRSEGGGTSGPAVGLGRGALEPSSC